MGAPAPDRTTETSRTDEPLTAQIRGRACGPTRRAGELPQVAALRHTLHRVPEIGLDLPLTQRARARRARGPRPRGQHGRGAQRRSPPCCAVPAPVRRCCCAATWTRCPSPRTAARSSPPSTRGVMHACGHDLHVAGLVGAARLLAARRDEIAGSVVFMFQPGEEGDGGARAHDRRGRAATPRASASSPRTACTSRPACCRRASSPAAPGTAMAARRHGPRDRPRQRAATARRRTARSTRCPSPREIVLALQAMVTRRFDVFDPVVVTVGVDPGGHREQRHPVVRRARRSPSARSPARPGARPRRCCASCASTSPPRTA